MLRHYHSTYMHVYQLVTKMYDNYAKQKQPRAVKKGTAKQSRIKSIKALVRARAQPVAK